MLQEIESLMQQGKLDEAIARINSALQTQPVNAKLHAYLGCCLFRKNQFELASMEFRKAITLDPKFWEAGLKLAQCLDRMMRYKEALEVAAEFLHQRPNEPALQTLVNGLKRQADAEEEESWQKHAKVTNHSVSFAHE